MRELPIDSARLVLVAASEATPVPVWQEVNGRRMPVEGQQQMTDTGLPLWQIDAMDSADPKTAELISVQVAAMSAPALSRFEQIEFEGLTVRQRVKDGKMTQYWSATNARLIKGKARVDIPA